jgi:hypothetical protein
MAKIMGELLAIPVPRDVGDFYISGTGHLCARTPVRCVVHEEPVSALGVVSNDQIVGRATLEQKAAAGLGEEDAVVLLRPNPSQLLAAARRRPGI